MIRKAEEKDIDRIAEIYERIHDEEENGDAHIGWKRNIYPAYQTAVDSVAKGEMFVLQKDKVVVAAARINHEQVKEYEDCPWQYPAADEDVMVLHTLVVDPAEKGHGYGTEFVRFYEKYAAEQNCPYLRMDTQEGNIPARTLYKKLGFREAGTVLCDFNGIPDIHLVCLEKKADIS